MKSNFCQQPFKLIDIDQDGVYHVVEQTLTLIESMSQSLAVISIAGQYRTGKSYLLNRVILNRADGFQVGSTINSCTKGLWIWGKPLIGKTVNNELINILVIDSEGFGSTDQQLNYDTKLFALNMLLTSCFLFNSMGAIDENGIETLALVAQIVQGISRKNNGQLDSPQLLWILRDFCLQLVSEQGKSMTSKQYLEKTLEYTKQQNKNKIRRLLMSVFLDRDCITLVRPLTQQQNLAQLNKLQLEDLRPEFIQQAISIRKRLLGQIKPKKYFGREVDGVLFCKMIRNYVDVINNNCVPQIQNIWKYVSQECIAEASCYFQQQLDMIVKERINSKLPICDQQLNRMLESIESMLLEQLKVKINCYQGSEQCINKCRKSVTKKCLQIHVANEGKLRSQIQKFLSIQCLMIEKKIGSTQLSSIQSLIFQFQRCSQSISKRMSIRSNKISQIVTSISLGKIIQSSKSLVYLKNKEIDNLKYKIKEEEIKFQQQLRELRGELQNSRSTSILQINKLETDRKQLQMREHNLNQIVQELKNQKFKLEESMETESRRQKSMSVRTVSEMKFRLDQFNDKTEESERKIMMIKSEHQKTEALLKQKIQFQERMIDQVKQQSTKYSERAKKLKETSGLEIKELTIKLQELNKSKLLQLMNCNQRIGDLELQVTRRTEEVEEQRQKKQKVISDYCFKEDELNKKIEQLETLLRQKQNKKASEDRLIQNMSKNFTKIQFLQKTIKQKDQLIIQLKNQLKLKQAILGQKVQFYQMEISEMNRKYQDQLSKNSTLMNIIGIKQEQLIKELKSKHQQNMKEMEAQYSFQINHLKAELDEILMRKYQSDQQYSLKTSQFLEQIKLLEGRNKMLQESKAKLTESLKLIQSQKARYLRQTEQRNSSTITSLNEQIERLKIQNTQEIRQLQEKNLQMMRHLKNYYEMEKEKYEKKILEYQQRQKQMPIQQYQSKILLLQSKNTAYQNEVQELRQQFTQFEKSHGSILKQYQQRVSELTIELNLIKQQKHHYIEQSSKERLRKEQSYVEQIQTLQSSLLSCQGKLDNCYSDILRKDKQILQVGQKKQQLEGQMHKKDQLVQELRTQIDDDRQNYERELKQMTQKYYKISEESLRYKIESQKQLALMRQQTQFNRKRIQQSEAQIQSLEAKISAAKIEYQNQYQHLVLKHNSELQTKIQAMDKLRRNHKDDEGRHFKTIGVLEKEKIHIQQQYKILELKLQSINKQYNRYKQEHSLTSNTDSSQYEIEILSLKSSLKQVRSRYQSEHSKLMEIQSNYQRDKLLWQNKSKFLQTQRDQAKQDLADGFKKFESALSQINKSRGNQDSLQEITKSIERKYTLQMENLKQGFDKKALESESTIKMLNVDIKKLKSELNKQKEMYQSKLQEQIELISLANNTISQQLTKQLQQKQYQNDKGKKQLSQKIVVLQKALKEMSIKMDHLKVGIEKDQVKFNIQKKGLTDNIQQLMANNEVLFRQNQRFKNKEKLLGKRFIKQF